MKKATLLMVVLLAVLTGTAFAKSHKVVRGDTLSAIAHSSNVSIESIMKINSQIKKANHIKVDWVIEIPDSSVVAKKKSVARKKVVIGIKENPAIYTDNEVGDDPWVGELIEALKLLGIDIPKDASLRFAFEGMEILPSGAIIHMVSGKNKIKWYRAELSPKKAEVRKLGVIVNRVRIGAVYLKPECANWLTWEKPPVPIAPLEPEKPIVEVPPTQPITVEIPPQEPTGWSYEEPPCSDCDELEFMGGGSIWVNGLGEDGESTGKNFWAEIMYWDNFEQDCSSEYWYGFGAIGSYYDYSATHLPSKGKGWRAAGETGVKGFHTSEIDDEGLEYSSSWQSKFRLGWEQSHWENPDTGKEINQKGPVYGLYGEYVRELIDPNKLSLVVQVELWEGFSQKISGPKEWNLDPQSREYFSALIGFDWKFADSWTLRAFPLGYNYQGWDYESVYAPQLQLIYDLPDNNGRLAFGIYGQFYSHLSPTLGILGRYESGNVFVKDPYSEYRVNQYKYVGKGIDN